MRNVHRTLAHNPPAEADGKIRPFIITCTPYLLAYNPRESDPLPRAPVMQGDGSHRNEPRFCTSNARSGDPVHKARRIEAGRRVPSPRNREAGKWKASAWKKQEIRSW